MVDFIHKVVDVSRQSIIARCSSEQRPRNMTAALGRGMSTRPLLIVECYHAFLVIYRGLDRDRCWRADGFPPVFIASAPLDPDGPPDYLRHESGVCRSIVATQASVATSRLTPDEADLI